MQKEIYFLGKLNQSLDFIVSENLQSDDKFFWDSWFGRCSNQDELISFTRKPFSMSKIWLFCIKRSGNITYTGIASLSLDLIGRRYPFVLFCKPTSHSEQVKSIDFITKKTNVFRNTLNSGKCFVQEYLDVNAMDTLPFLPQAFLNFLSQSNNNIGSFWQESGGSSHIEQDGEPSCFLFNKIFGL